MILAENLACVGRECDADALRVVQVAEPTATSTAIHYEYVRPPCKEQVFYANAKKVTNKERWAYSSCANPLLVRLCVFFYYIFQYVCALAHHKYMFLQCKNSPTRPRRVAKTTPISSQKGPPVTCTIKSECCMPLQVSCEMLVFSLLSGS